MTFPQDMHSYHILTSRPLTWLLTPISADLVRESQQTSVGALLTSPRPVLSAIR